MRFLFAWLPPSLLLFIASPANTAAAPPTPDFDLSWETQAWRQCKYGEFEMFLKVFMRSRHVQKQYMARIVKAVRFGKTTRVERQNYRSVPIEMSDYHLMIRRDEQAIFAPVTLKADLLPFGKGAYRLDWIRANYDDSDEEYRLGEVVSTEGAPGYLLFKKSHSCWQLTHDAISEEN